MTHWLTSKAHIYPKDSLEYIYVDVHGMILFSMLIDIVLVVIIVKNIIVIGIMIIVVWHMFNVFHESA